MDMVSACRVFVRAAERGSISLGAASVDVEQSVASRRIAALEARFGAALFERTARTVVLTPFGRDMLAPSRRLVQLADTLDADAERAKARPLTLAVPTMSRVRDLAVLDAEARAVGLALDYLYARPDERALAVKSGQARAALVAVPADLAEWSVPLGLASREEGSLEAVPLRALRPSRRGGGTTKGGMAGRRLRLLPEDDLAHVRDILLRAGAAAGLLTGQIVPDISEATAVSAALRDGDMVLCSHDEADSFAMTWRPLVEPSLRRGYALVSDRPGDATLLTQHLEESIAALLGGTIERQHE